MRHFILLSVFVLLVLCSTVMSVAAQTATAPSGSGTEGDPYLIATLDNLYWVTQNSSSWGAYFQQTADIDASSTTAWDDGAGFSPIGNSATKFTGVYDGVGHTITGLYTARYDYYQGLFGEAQGAEIKNIGMLDVDITQGDVYAGAIVGLNSYGSTVDNCYSTGSVSGSSSVGGLVGANYSNATVSNSYSTANVSGAVTSGGLVGTHYANCLISNSYSRGNVVRTFGGATTFGGLVGKNDGGAVQYCYSTGSVSFGTGQGFVGSEAGSPSYTGNFFDAEASGQASGLGATAKTTAEMKTALMFLFAGWDHEVWNIGDGINDGYPYADRQNPEGTSLLNALAPSGSGTEGDPYLIATLEDLFWVTQSSSSWGANFLQTDDIDASATSTWDGGAGFTPIGNSATFFTGTYDGDGNTITGLYISRSTTDQVGMFGRSDGNIQNLGLLDVDITGQNQTGGLAGLFINFVTMSNCYTTGAVSGNNNVGGLVGRFIGGVTISNSYSTASVTGASFSIGGLVGIMQSSATISNSYSTGNISGELETGGLVGYASSESIISNSYSRGNVTRTSGNNTSVGGFVGTNGATIQNSYSTGSVNFGATQGFAGTEAGSSSYTNNFFDSEASGQTSGAGATAKTTAEMKTAYTFLAGEWDADVWYRDSGVNDAYPYLAWQNPGGTMLQWPEITLTSGDAQSKQHSSAPDNPFVVTVTDEDDNPVPGVPVTFAIATTPDGASGQELSVINATTDASGEASTVLTLGTKVGNYTVTATSEELTGSPVTFTVTATAGPAANLVLTSGDEQSKQHSTALDDQFVVTITDAGGNPIAGTSVTFAIATTPASAIGQSLSVENTTTDANGLAQTRLTLGNKSGIYTVTASSDGLTGSPVTFTATAEASAAVTIALTSGDGQSQLHSSALDNPFVVTITDAEDNLVPGVNVTFAIATTPDGATGQELSVTNTTTDANGEASTALTLGTRAGSYTVTAASDGLTGSPVTFTATAEAGVASNLVSTSGNNQSALISTALDNPFVATVTDAGGNPISGVAVTFAIATTPASATGQEISVTNTTTNASGEASTILTLGNKVGIYTVTATSAVLTGSPVTFTGSATSSVATTIALTSGNEQSTVHNLALANPFVVTVTDVGGNPVENAAVTFAIASTPEGAIGQELSVENTTTNASGEASTTLTLGNKAGTYTITATSGSLSGSPVTFIATAQVGLATTIALTSGDAQSAVQSTSLPTPFVVTVTDGGGNPVQDVAVVFAIATVPEGATGQELSILNDTTDASGVALTVLTLGTKVGSYTVTATSDGLTGSPVTFTATATVGAAASISLTSGNGQTAAVNLPLSNPFVVTVTDAGGNLVESVAVSFTIATTPTGSAGQQISVTDATTDASGEASTVLTLGDKVGVYTVTAISGTLAGSPVTFSASATGGTATTIALTAGDAQNATVGTDLANPFVVIVKDASENLVEGVAVTFAIATTPEGATRQELSIINDTTDANGEASTVLTLGGTAGSYSVTATAEGLSGSPVTFTATAEAGAAAAISLTSGNSQSAAISSELSNPFTVAVTDAEGNPVQDVVVTFAIASAPEGTSGQQLSATIDTTGADGKASTVFTLGTKVGSYTVTAISTGLTGSPVTFTVTAVAGVPSKLILVSGNEQSGPIDSVLAEQLVVRVTDVGDNPVEGVEVAFVVTTAPVGAVNHSVQPSSAMTDSAGYASTELTLGSVEGEYLVTASVAGVDSVQFSATAIGPTSVGALGSIPTEYQLFQNFPNPFNPSTTIRFGVPERSAVTVEIYDIVGRLVDVIAEGEQLAGTYQVQWNAHNASSGTYIVRFRAKSLSSDKSFTSYRKLVLLK